MSAGRRLLGFICLTLLVGLASEWLAHKWLRVPETSQDLGLRWLKEEFHLSDEAYPKVVEMHQAYFTRCQDMCKKLDAAMRPLFWRARKRMTKDPSSGAEFDRNVERALCMNCEEQMVAHLQRVAELMPADEGSRFLKIILPEVLEQHQKHDRRVSILMQR